MRALIFSGLTFLVLAISPVAAADSHDAAGISNGQPSLDQLFGQLRQESNEAAARRIANRIRNEWRASGGATADLLIDWAREAASQQNYHVALDLLDQAVVLYPDYVESWNSRALIYLMMNDFSRAMSDLAHVLSIEPRHFGALSGLAGILRATEREELAVQVYRRMLEIYPMQRSAQRALIRLVDDQTDERL